MVVILWNISKYGYVSEERSCFGFGCICLECRSNYIIILRMLACHSFLVELALLLLYLISQVLFVVLLSR